ncbi:MAG: DUF2089 domain-containing protein [Armatimonadetes bacterium]|nr:DUF2089 domain-containing protein [Armatimonadota bacterium]
MPGACPVCGDALAVVRLECSTCQTAVEGRYRASRFAGLSADQIAFLEVFLRSRGNIRKVEREMGISYPTVRSRLDAVLSTLGLAVGIEEDEAAFQQRRREIMDMLEAGDLTPAEATRMLRQSSKTE